MPPGQAKSLDIGAFIYREKRESVPYGRGWQKKECRTKQKL